MIPSFRLFLSVLALTTLAGAHADPLAELTALSNLKGLKLENLAKGSLKSGSMPQMKFARGLGVEICYVVRKPLARTAELHTQWTPSQHPELKVYLHGDLPAHPAAGDFARLSSAPGNGAVKSFAASTLKLGGGGTKLQVSNADAKSAPSEGSGGPMPASVTAFWSGVLAQRAQAYASGGLGKLPPYETAGETVRVSDEVARLLQEAPKVRSQFSGLIGKGSPSMYWELFDADDQAAVSLGASYSKKSADSFQSAEVQYYSSGGFYALLTFYQMWPVNLDGQDCTLVWRGDLISSAELGSRPPTERMGATSAMIRETEKSVKAFLADTSK